MVSTRVADLQWRIERKRESLRLVFEQIRSRKDELGLSRSAEVPLGIDATLDKLRSTIKHISSDLRELKATLLRIESHTDATAA